MKDHDEPCWDERLAFLIASMFLLFALFHLIG